MTLEVINRTEASRYELVENDAIVGYADYRERGDDRLVLEFPHTVIDPNQRGRGLGEILVDGAMADVRRRGAVVVPTCWFVAEWFTNHPDDRDLLA